MSSVELGAVFCIITSGLSIVGGVWLLWSLPPCCARQRLFPRQLKLLAWVDLLGSVPFACAILVEYGFIRLSTESGTRILCGASLGGFRWMRIASVLIETHVAAGVACGWRRWRHALVLVTSSLWALPALALGLAILSTLWVSKVDYDPGSSHRCLPMRSEWVSISVMIVGFVLSIVLYAIAFAETRRSTDSVQQATLRRTLVYPINFLLTYGLTFYVLCFPTASNRDLLVLADSLEGLNGFLNAAAYYFQLSTARKEKLMSVKGDIDQMHEHFGVANGASAASYHVCFDPTNNSDIGGSATGRSSDEGSMVP